MSAAAHADMIEHLRRIARGYRLSATVVVGNLDDAADKIDSLAGEVTRLQRLLAAALPSVEADADMMNAMDRHSPLPTADMPSVTAEAGRLYRLREEIRAALPKETT